MIRRTGLDRLVWLFGRLLRETRGSVALQFAFIGPAVLLLGVGAIDLMAVATAQGRLQAIADAGALAGAPALALATDGASAKERAASFVAGEISQWPDAPDFVGTYEIVDRAGQRAIRVLLEGHRPSFFANMLPPGGWHFIGDASATSVGLVPLCVLVTQNSGSQLLHAKDASRMNAPSCMVHSNRDIEVEGGSITAAAVQAVTSARGFISPSANTGAAPIDDPFSGLALERQRGFNIGCTVAELTNWIRVTTGTHSIPPGRHCGGVEARGTARIVMQPGEHFFLQGHLVIDETARLEGQDVVLFFDQASKFEFKGQARVKLDGRKSGAYAGIVMGSLRDNRQDFVISADHVESLLGVIYVPSARLIVAGTADVARESAWTVIVAHKVQLRGSPSLFINANYSASDVPVPAGVGPRAGGSRLIH